MSNVNDLTPRSRLLIDEGQIAVRRLAAVTYENSFTTQQVVNTVLTANALTGHTSIQVASVDGFLDGDNITIILDNGGLHNTVVDGAPVGNAIALVDAMPSQANAGNRVEMALSEVAQARGGQNTLSDRLAQIVSAYTAADVSAARLVGSRDALIRNLEPAADNVPSHVTAEYGNATTRYIWQRINGIKWLRTQMDYLASSGSWVTGEMRIYQVLDAIYNDDDPAITYGGTGAWLTQSGGAATGAVGGTRHYSYNADHYLEFEISGVTAIWIAYEKNTLGGYIAPLINGGQALTRQYMPEEIGGYYAWPTFGVSTPATVQQIAGNLDPARTYTVRLQTVGAGPSDDRFYFEAVIGDPKRYDAAVSVANTTKRLETPADADSGWTLSYTPTGATVVELAGNRHLNEVVSSVTWTDEVGNSIVPDATTTLKTARQLTVTQVSTLRHSQTGSTDHATVIRTITFFQASIRYTLRIAWSSTATVHYTYYGMMPALMDKLQIAGWPTQYTLTQNNNLRYGQKKSCAAAMWHTGHPYVLAYWFDDPASVANLGVNGFIEYLDAVIPGGKLYPKLVNDNAAVTNGDVWLAAWTWKWYEIPGVANRL